MPGKVLVFELCSELEQELIRQQLSEDTLKRYRKYLMNFLCLEVKKYIISHWEPSFL